MSDDIDHGTVRDLLDPAYDAMQTLDEEEGLTTSLPERYGDQPRERYQSVLAAWQGDDGIMRNVEASVDPDTYELKIAYNAWSDHSITDHEDDVRLWTREEIATFADPTDAIDEAVRHAYEEAQDVRDGDLERAERIPHHDL